MFERNVNHGGLNFTNSLEERVKDALIIATEWGVFRTPNFNKLQNSLNDKVIFDGRYLYEKIHVYPNALQYISIGREGVDTISSNIVRKAS